MISGIKADLLDSQDTMTNEVSKLEDNGLTYSQETFSEIWNELSQSQGLFSEINDIIQQNNNESINQSSISDFLVEDCNDQVSIQGCSGLQNCVNLKQEDLLLEVNEDNSEIVKCDESWTDFPGFINFSLNCSTLNDKTTRSTKFTYSTKLNKLFVQMDETCPLQFNCKYTPPVGCYIKIIPYYKTLQDKSKPVEPCLLHQKSAIDKPNNLNSLIEIQSKNAFCTIIESDRLALCVPYTSAEQTTVLLKFRCLSSCKSGINKRPVALVFRLETSTGEMLGRRVVDVCICTRPDRDRDNHEKKQEPSCNKRLLKRRHPSPTIVQDSSSESDDDQIYLMPVRGKKTYRRLLSIKQAFDMEKLVADDKKKEYYKREAAAGNSRV